MEPSSVTGAPDRGPEACSVMSPTGPSRGGEMSRNALLCSRSRGSGPGGATPADLAMATRLLCCAALCLLGAGPTDAAGVIQTPRHKVTESGQEVTLNCTPISGHTYLYWYRQASGQEPEFLIYFSNQRSVDDSGMPKARFSAVMPSGSLSTLKIQPTEPGDSATYLCASSLATALRSPPLPVQKPWRFPSSPQPPPTSAVSAGQGLGLVSAQSLGETRAGHAHSIASGTFVHEATGARGLSFLLILTPEG